MGFLTLRGCWPTSAAAVRTPNPRLQPGWGELATWMQTWEPADATQVWLVQTKFLGLLWMIAVVTFGTSYVSTSITALFFASVESFALAVYGMFLVYGLQEHHGRGVCRRIASSVCMGLMSVFLTLELIDRSVWDYHAVHDVKLPTLERGAKLAAHMRIRPQDIVLIGNGPLSTQQRHRLIRPASPSQVYRFNGLSNLHPGEPLGHVFARLINPDSAPFGIPAGAVGKDRDAVPWYFWGLEPPLRLDTFTLQLPILRQLSTHCHRLPNEAVSITLVNGRAEDADWYAKHLGIPVTYMPCDAVCRSPPPGSKHGWTTGTRALFHLLNRTLEARSAHEDSHHNATRRAAAKRAAPRIHVLGMNWANKKGSSQDSFHSREREKQVVLRELGASGRIVVHPTPSLAYHTRMSVSHLGIKGEWLQFFPCEVWTAHYNGDSLGEWPPPHLVEFAITLPVVGVALGIALWWLCSPYGRYAAHHSHIVMMVLAITGRAAALMAALLVLSWLLPAMFSGIALVGKVAEALCHCVWIAPWK